MAIILRQPGEAELYAKAGRAIGKQKKAQRAQEAAERQERQAIQIAERRRVEQASREWELQKMQMRSQQDFLHDQRMIALDQEKFERAKRWDIDKMELASRFDFEQEEKERQRRIATYRAGKEVIDNNEGLTDMEKRNAHFLLSSKYTDIPEAAVGLGLKPQRQTSDTELAAAIRELTGETTSPQAATTAPSPVESGTVLVRNNKGIYGTIPVEQLEEAIADGYTVIDETQLFQESREKKQAQEEQDLKALTEALKGFRRYGGI